MLSLTKTHTHVGWFNCSFNAKCCVDAHVAETARKDFSFCFTPKNSRNKQIANDIDKDMNQMFRVKWCQSVGYFQCKYVGHEFKSPRGSETSSI